MVTRAQVDAHRRDLGELTGLAESDLRILFREFDSAEAAREGLRDVLPQLVALYGSAAATLGADWYDDLRDAEGAAGRFSAIPAELPDAGRTDALARWGIEPLFAAEPDFDTSLTKVAGGLQRVVANADRQSIAQSSVADPAAAGWKRIGTGACAFCRMLIERDELYSEATADFASHDHCNCSAYPLIKGAEPINVKDYVRTTRNITDADRARVRKWLADNPSA